MPTGSPGTNVSYQWQDTSGGTAAMKHIGLSCWDKHVSYRRIQVRS